MKSKKHKKYTEKELAIEALKYSTRWNFQKGASGAYSSAYKMGILNKICSHMQNNSICWTEDLIRIEALKYENIKAFQKGRQSAYNAARRLNILRKICSHMKQLHCDWNLDKISIEALKYSSRWVFQKNSNAYYAAKHKGILEQVCSHMQRSPGHSTNEKQLLDIIKKHFPEVKKYRDMKVKIAGKPHIGGFELDIFSSIIKKGIEFDGTYWHSFQGLKRRKPNWPDEDIHNYHNLKDAWFKYKGIDVLHIKEKEWEQDKNACIKKCLEFLEERYE